MSFLHLGFFMFFDLLYAFTSFLLVIVFSLSVGYIMDKTKNIILPITVHIAINFTHYLVYILLV